MNSYSYSNYVFVGQDVRHQVIGRLIYRYIPTFVLTHTIQ